ncbi:MAG: hypothetical protein MUF58_07285 [Arcicella sp.]|jgi:hypothetical protein|nr:hypothetical protein [Arcicella sp.]
MAYKNFTLEKLKKDFGIINRSQSLFESVEPIQASNWLKETLETSQLLPKRSEKARSEWFVAPILMELKKRNSDFLTIHSGDNLNADTKSGLNGECDFIIGKNTHSFTIDAPLFAVVEAKKQDFDLGIAQCAAQMLGAKIFNEKENQPLSVIYGAVTTADDWLFLKLENNILIIDNELYPYKELSTVLGILQKIVDLYK